MLFAKIYITNEPIFEMVMIFTSKSPLMQLGYPEHIFINKITVYDTACAGSSVSQVSVWNPYAQAYVTVFTNQGANCNNFLVANTQELEFPVK